MNAGHQYQCDACRYRENRAYQRHDIILGVVCRADKRSDRGGDHCQSGQDRQDTGCRITLDRVYRSRFAVKNVDKNADNKQTQRNTNDCIGNCHLIHSEYFAALIRSENAHHSEHDHRQSCGDKGNDGIFYLHIMILRSC